MMEFSIHEPTAEFLLRSLYFIHIYSEILIQLDFYSISHDLKHPIKVTGHPFWRFVENRYCALKICPIFIKFSPNVSKCMQNMIKL